MLISLYLIGRYRPKFSSKNVSKTVEILRLLPVLMWVVSVQIVQCQQEGASHFDDALVGNFSETDGQRNGRSK